MSSFSWMKPMPSMAHLPFGIIYDYNAESVLCKGFSKGSTSKTAMHTLLLKRASI